MTPNNVQQSPDPPLLCYMKKRLVTLGWRYLNRKLTLPFELTVGQQTLQQIWAIHIPETGPD